ncbi:Putative sulfatase, alkaline-phosphatase-like, core domain superfamily [Colletotrichum destructivum]|uniref:Sulfatase, alkaline-phosphatase-like, core domain superfamily n=1 Tax=Colletotrichum destructivum TaxID=34406 RepID=A0AAX4J3W8_9PEZI|nr:Putative sulfatase, alkaline-phosphatase-like, core domain superfamily [Colletotrichum destructivum]
MTSARPNIIFIMADDHASKAISAYGACINHTPNIDRLAEEGMKFNHCYVTNSICTPSRAAILTGTHNHVNGVMTLNDNINKHLPNVAKHLRTGGYRTAMVGKWHLGEGKAHEPTGFDYWSVLPGQGDYWDPEFIEETGARVENGYVTDIITDKSLNWISETTRDTEKKPFFLMCHHKAPHRSWEYDEKHKKLYTDPIRVPETYDDDYKNRAKAAKVAKMRVAEDMTYQDLGLIQPDGGNAVGERVVQESGSAQRKVPVDAKRLIDKEDGTVFTFKSADDLAHFKFQRYMQRYLRVIQSVDDNVGRMLDYLEENGLAENTIVIYTSDQGFFLGEHGWFDKRFMYEESFQMPFLVRYPAAIAKGSVCDDIICNVDFAPTFLDLADLTVPSYMQGVSFRRLLQGDTPADWQQVAYHRYWMHNDIIHHAYAHYGVRDQRYKLIYWYNEPLEIEGARPGGEEDKEWELFDCEKDPLELFNVYNDQAYEEVVKHMTQDIMHPPLIKMKFSAVLLFVASVAAVALDTDVPPALSQPGRRGVDCGACDRLNFCPGKPNNNVECELDGCCKN